MVGMAFLWHEKHKGKNRYPKITVKREKVDRVNNRFPIQEKGSESRKYKP